MMEMVERETVDGFYTALANRDFETVASYIDDNIQWSISGPVDLLPFCGRRVGKKAVLDVIVRQVPKVLPLREFIPDVKLIDGDRAAILGRLFAKHAESGRAVNYRIAHFMRFKNGKLIEYTSVLDSFDAAEQVTGRRIGIADGTRSLDTSRDLVAV